MSVKYFHKNTATRNIRPLHINFEGVKSFLGCRKNNYLAINIGLNIGLDIGSNIGFQYWVEYRAQYWISILG